MSRGGDTPTRVMASGEEGSEVRQPAEVWVIIYLRTHSHAHARTHTKTHKCL